MSEPEYIEVRGDTDAVVRISVYPARGAARRGPAFDAFFAEARARLVPDLVLIGGPAPESYDDRTSFASFLFTLDHIPLPMEEILEWLRDHPLVRLIEVDRFGVATGQPDER